MTLSAWPGVVIYIFSRPAAHITTLPATAVTGQKTSNGVSDRGLRYFSVRLAPARGSTSSEACQIQFVDSFLMGLLIYRVRGAGRF